VAARARSVTCALAILLGARIAAAGQTAEADHTRSFVSASTIAAIRSALEQPPAVKLNLDGNGLRFQMQVLAKQRTFASYLRGTDIPFGRPEPFDARQVLGAGGHGGGFDVLPLIVSAVNKAREARRNYLIRKINEQIDRELEALDEARRTREAKPEP
jgi:hypothetical protein